MRSNIFLGISILIGGLIVPIICIAKYIEFIQNCEGYLKQAADATTVEIAYERLDMAIFYLERKGYTSGYTSILIKTEDENIEFWYNNLIQCKNELKKAEDKSQLEQTNVLMKVRESLADSGQYGTQITIPTGLCYYPNNLLLKILRFISYILIGAAIYIFIDD